MNKELLTLHAIDRAGFYDEDLFITGTTKSVRPDQSHKDPGYVAEQMVAKFEIIEPGMKILEPCAGMGALLDALVPFTQSTFQKYQDWKVTMNEIDSHKRQILKFHYPFFRILENGNSLHESCPEGKCSSVQGKYDKVVFNPPFHKAHEFLRMALYYWCKPGGEIVLLFPTLSLSRLHSCPKSFLHLFSCKKFTHEQIEYSCNYPVKVSLIHIIK